MALIVAPGWRRSGGPRSVRSPEHVQWVDTGLVAQILDGLERQIPLAALDAAHVRAVYANDVGELLLAQPARPPYRPQAGTKGALEITQSHPTSIVDMILIGLHTYE